MTTTTTTIGIGDTVKVQMSHRPWGEGEQTLTRTGVVQEYSPSGAGHVPAEPRWRVAFPAGRPIGGWFTAAEMGLTQE